MKIPRFYEKSNSVFPNSFGKIISLFFIFIFDFISNFPTIGWNLVLYEWLNNRYLIMPQIIEIVEPRNIISDFSENQCSIIN